MHNELDRLAENAFAREQGFAEGEAKGKAEGKADEKADIAKAMLADNVNPAMIAKYTGLSEEEIRKLSQSPEIKGKKSWRNTSGHTRPQPGAPTTVSGLSEHRAGPICDREDNPCPADDHDQTKR